MSVKRVKVVERRKEIASLFTCCPVNREYLWKKSQIEKKTKTKKSKLCFTTCKNSLSVYVDKERLESFMTEVPIIQKPVHWFAEKINGLVSIWQVAICMNSLSYILWLCQNNWHLCIQYQRRMLLINQLSKN